MSFLFTCPHCGTRTQVDQRYTGRSGPCAVCGRTVTVPLATTVDAAAGGPSQLEQKPRSLTLLVAVIIGAVVAALFGLAVLLLVLLPAGGGLRGQAQLSACSKNLKRIGIALHAYHDRHGCFPPAYLADPQGRPMHSWRVLLLPYLDELSLYEQYDFTQPWDSPANLRLATQMPQVYQCPADPEEASEGETSYLAITGPATVFRGAQSASLGDITDGLSDTIMLVESTAAGICWLEPTDIASQNIQLMVNAVGATEIGSYHARGAHVLACDGSVKQLPNYTRPALIHAMITTDADDYVDWSSIGY